MFKTFVLVLVVSPLLSACREQVKLYQEKHILMDTMVSITIYAVEEPQNWQADVRKAFEIMQEIEDAATSYNDSSEVGRINKWAGQKTIRVSTPVLDIIHQSIEVSKESAGAFDISILPLLLLWNFKAATPVVPSPEAVREKLDLVGYRKIQIDGDEVFLPQQGMGLDLGGIAKGFAVDKAVEVLKSKGYTDFMVEAGGDLRTVAGKLTQDQRRIWVRHPRKADDFFATINKDEAAVATSGDYERSFEINGKKYHHIIDPRTGFPATPVVSVTILAEQTSIADAYATAIFVLGPEKGLELIEKNPSIEGLIVYKKESSTDSILNWKVSKGITPHLEIVH